MTPDAIRKLLGGYATGTLTPEEQAALFAAALEDQELFDALAREQSLRDLLRDPVARADLLAALEPPTRAGFWQWLRTPVVAGLVTAGVAAIAIIAVWQSTRVVPVKLPPPTIVAEVRPPQPPPAVAAPQSRDAAGAAVYVDRLFAPPAVAAPQSRDAAPLRTAPAPRRKALPSSTPTVAAPPAASPPPPSPPPAAAPPAAEPEKSAASAGAISTRAGLSADRLAAVQAGAPAPIPPSLRCTVLRQDGEVEMATPLNPGETIRLRIVPNSDGVVSVLESGQVLATGPAQRQQPFETPPLPFTGSGARRLSLTFLRSAPAPATPLIVQVTLTYR